MRPGAWATVLLLIFLLCALVAWHRTAHDLRLQRMSEALYHYDIRTGEPVRR